MIGLTHFDPRRVPASRRGMTLVEILVVIVIIGVLIALLLPAVQNARESARRAMCLSGMRQIALGVHQYYQSWGGQFFLHHPFDADVIANAGPSNSFAEIYWEDKILPYVRGGPTDESLAKQGLLGSDEGIYRCPTDNSQLVLTRDDGGAPDGFANRTSFLMNSLLSHKTRRYGRWNFTRFQTTIGLSNFVMFTERYAPNLDEAPLSKQDDFDIWLGTTNIQPWMAYQRHDKVANYLYMDGHAATLLWQAAVIGLYPDGNVLVNDASYPQ